MNFVNSLLSVLSDSFIINLNYIINFIVLTILKIIINVPEESGLCSHVPWRRRLGAEGPGEQGRVRPLQTQHLHGHVTRGALDKDTCGRTSIEISEISTRVSDNK